MSVDWSMDSDDSCVVALVLLLPTSTPNSPSHSNPHYFHTDLLSHDLVAEDDDDLLCDFAPHAMQSDGSLGLVGTDGITVSMPVSPKVTKGTGTASYKANADQHAELLRQHSLSNEDSMAYRRPVTDACLSDSWQALDFEHARNDNNLGSITQLRQQYQRVFGKETSSNNRQWLLRRLAEINGTCGSDDVDDDADDSGDFYSGDGSDDAGDSSPFTDASAGTHTDFFGAGESARVRRNSMSKSDSQIGERGQRHNGKNKRGSSNDSDKSSNDLSASGKKRKGGHHSDSDDQQEGEESPVKSRNTGGGHYRGGGGGKGASPRGRDAVGANGRRSKHHNPWALEEAEALVDGVARCGGGKWADIKKLGFPAIEHRTAVDLKDKWRNLLRIAMLPHQPVKSAGDKKREIPAELLNRVRDLAAKQAKKAAADGRSRTGGR